MTQENQRQDVAVFVDFENVYISVRDKLDANPNFETIMERCTELGRIVIARAYADWYRYPRITSALYANGIDPIYVPTYHYTKDTGRTGGAIKNSADMHLCIDAMKTLFMHGNIAKYVFITGDRDFIPLVNSIRQQGKDVIIIGIGGAASTHLAQSADEFIFYEQLVGKTVAPQRGRAQSDTSKLDTVAETDIYDTLVQAVHLVRERGYVSTLGSLKLVMKELMGGDFKESRYKDLKGRPFTKFKDFVVDAEKRGKVQIYTSGTVNEVFLPGEDAARLSQFSEALKDSPEEPGYHTPEMSNGRQEKPSTEPQQETASSSSSSRSRRRRRPSRNKQQNGDSQPSEITTPAALNDAPDDLLSDEHADALATDAGTPSVLANGVAQDEVFSVEEASAESTESLIPERSEWDEGTPDDVLTFNDLQYESDDDKTRSDEQLLRQWERARSLLMESESRSTVDVDQVFASVSSSEAISSMRESDLFARARALLDATAPKDTVSDATEPEQVSESDEFAEQVTELEASEQSSDVPEALPEMEDTEQPSTQADDMLDTGDVAAPGDDSAEDDTDEVQTQTAASEELAASHTQPLAEMALAGEYTDTATLQAERDNGTGYDISGAPATDVETTESTDSTEAEQVLSDAPETPNTDAPDAADPDAVDTNGDTFSDEEWHIFSTMMSEFSKPVSFGHIFDALRELRNQQQLTRTNEQLRSMIKQAINKGLLDRSGRGMRVYYRLTEAEN